MNLQRMALDAAVRKGADRGVKSYVEMEQARRDVAGFVMGEIPAMDSAAAVYRMALDAAGVSTKDVPDVGMRAVFEAWRRNGNGRPRVAMDEQAISRREARFPHANRLGWTLGRAE